MKSKNIFERTTDEYFAHLKKEYELFIKNKGCPVCLGDGKLKEKLFLFFFLFIFIVYDKKTTQRTN